MKGTRKEITFDLDTNQLQKYYPSKNWRKAYVDIKKHMLKNGFSWQQGFVYVSNGLQTNPELTDYLDQLASKQPWLNVCMRDCTVTNVGRIHNQTYLFSKERLLQKLEKSKDVKAKTSEKEKEEEVDI